MVGLSCVTWPVPPPPLAGLLGSAMWLTPREGSPMHICPLTLWRSAKEVGEVGSVQPLRASCRVKVGEQGLVGWREGGRVGESLLARGCCGSSLKARGGRPCRLSGGDRGRGSLREGQSSKDKLGIRPQLTTDTLNTEGGPSSLPWEAQASRADSAWSSSQGGCEAKVEKSMEGTVFVGHCWPFPGSPRASHARQRQGWPGPRAVFLL